jgi:hypothetical protein
MKIPVHVLTVCKLGAMAECCRYLMMSPTGWDCAKLQPQYRVTIDIQAAEGKMKALGDHCDGKTAQELRA